MPGVHLRRKLRIWEEEQICSWSRSLCNPEIHHVPSSLSSKEVGSAQCHGTIMEELDRAGIWQNSEWLVIGFIFIWFIIIALNVYFLGLTGGMPCIWCKYNYINYAYMPIQEYMGWCVDGSSSRGLLMFSFPCVAFPSLYVVKRCISGQQLSAPLDCPGISDVSGILW